MPVVRRPDDEQPFPINDEYRDRPSGTPSLTPPIQLKQTSDSLGRDARDAPAAMTEDERREADFTAQERWLATPEGQRAVETAQETWVQQQQAYVYSDQRTKDIEKAQQDWVAEQQATVTPKPEPRGPYVDPNTAQTYAPETGIVNRDTEGGLYGDTRTDAQKQADLERGAEEWEQAIEGGINAIRSQAETKLVQAGEAKARGDFVGTFLGFAGYTVGKLGAGVAEGATFFIRPKQIVGVPTTIAALVTDEKARGEIFGQVAKDPGGFLLEGIGGVLGGYAVGKGFGKLVDAIEGPKGSISQLKQVKVEQVPTETYVDDAGNVYQTGRGVKTRLTPTVEKTTVPRDVFKMLEEGSGDVGPLKYVEGRGLVEVKPGPKGIDTLYGYTKNKGFKSGYQVKVSPAEAEALLKGQTVEGSFIKGGRVGLDKAEFPDVYAVQKGQPVKGGGVQYFKEPSPMGPSIEGELATINRGGFKLRVTGALEAEIPPVETQMFTRPTGGVKTPFYSDLFPAKGAGSAIDKIIKSEGLPSRLGRVTKPTPELDVFAKFRQTQVSRVTPLETSYGGGASFSAVSLTPSQMPSPLMENPVRAASSQTGELPMPKITRPSLMTPPKPRDRVATTPPIFKGLEGEKPKTPEPTKPPMLIQKTPPITIPRMPDVEEPKQPTPQIFKQITGQQPKQETPPFVPPPTFRWQPEPTSTQRPRKRYPWDVGFGGGKKTATVKARVEFTPAPTEKRLKKRLGL